MLFFFYVCLWKSLICATISLYFFFIFKGCDMYAYYRRGNVSIIFFSANLLKHLFLQPNVSKFLLHIDDGFNFLSFGLSRKFLRAIWTRLRFWTQAKRKSSEFVMVSASCGPVLMCLHLWSWFYKAFLEFQMFRTRFVLNVSCCLGRLKTTWNSSMQSL